jgi:hypothetical protein
MTRPVVGFLGLLALRAGDNDEEIHKLVTEAEKTAAK